MRIQPWLLCSVLFLLFGCSGTTGTSAVVEDAGVWVPDNSGIPQTDGTVGSEGGGDDAESAPSDAGDTHQQDTEEPFCLPGEVSCLNDETPAVCVDNAFLPSTLCPAGTTCLEGGCVPIAESCTPGEVGGCFNEYTLMVCEETGKLFEAEPCPDGEYCFEGECGDKLCEPGTLKCVSLVQPGQCNGEGTAWDPLPVCEDDGTCEEGACKSGCAGLVKYGTSYIGCEYWSVDLDQYDDPFGDPKNAPYGVVVSNPGDSNAVITFVMGDGSAFDPGDTTVFPGDSRKFVLPTLNDDGTGISNKSVQILSNRPITVHQFNPMDNLSEVASNDASLLLPVNALGTEYYVLSWPTSPLVGDIIPDIEGECCTDADCPGTQVCCELPLIGITSCDDGCSFLEVPSTCGEGEGGGGGFADLQPQHGYVTVVASAPGKTLVTATVTGLVIAGPGVDPMQPGDTQTFDLNQFDVLSLQADPDETQSIFAQGAGLDMTGTHILSDKPVVVFAGHEEAVVGIPADAPGAGQNTDSCCAEHLEEQLFPVSSWGQDLLCVKTRPRGTPSEPDHWRVIAATDGTQLSTTPSIPGIDGAVLSKGEWVEGITPESFMLNASAPIQVGQYTVGQQMTQDMTGDPSLILAVPESQFRKDYILLTPQGYDENYITVIRPSGVPVMLDGVEIATGDFQPFGDGTWERAYVNVPEGTHNLLSESAFGLTAYGWSAAVSYGYPGGLDLEANSP